VGNARRLIPLPDLEIGPGEIIGVSSFFVQEKPELTRMALSERKAELAKRLEKKRASRQDGVA
jgi:hypothetical protein